MKMWLFQLFRIKNSPMTPSSPLLIKSQFRKRHDVDPSDQSQWHIIDNRRRRGRNVRSVILYLSIVALLVLLLLNHRSAHRYVEPSSRRLEYSRTSVRSNTHTKKRAHPTQGRDIRDSSPTSKAHHHSHNHQHHSTSVSTEDTLSLRQEFENWVQMHRRDYGSNTETETRFQIWKENHLRTIQKNALHGPCKHTHKHVFGSNHFKDLSPLEFRNRFLSGYGGPNASLLNSTTHKMYTTHQHPHFLHNRHEAVHSKYLEYIQNHASWFESESESESDSRSLNRVSPDYFANTTTQCSWFEITRREYLYEKLSTKYYII